jgi:plastocyanin
MLLPHAKRLTLLVVLFAAAGCGSGTSSTSRPGALTNTGAATSAGAVQVTINNFAFSPVVVQARVGETVVWVNDDAPPHNVTYVSGPSFTSSSTVMKTGAKFSVKLGQAGRIRYYCTLHPWMKATIVVAP